MVDISVSSIPNQQQAASNATQSGVVAPQTENQRAEASAKNVTVSDSSRQLVDNARDAEQKKFDSIKQIAASYKSGKNPFLNDVSFTIYNGSRDSVIGSYEIRFTDISTGSIEIKSESELFAASGSGVIASGSV